VDANSRVIELDSKAMRLQEVDSILTKVECEKQELEEKIRSFETSLNESFKVNEDLNVKVNETKELFNENQEHLNKEKMSLEDKLSALINDLELKDSLVNDLQQALADKGEEIKASQGMTQLL
jgi:predicted nuclease with TOPRIM domain